MSDKLEDNATLETIQEDYREAVGVFPALRKYKDEHNTANLQKLCVEVVEFCRAIYASTQNEAERRIYKDMLSKLN